MFRFAWVTLWVLVGCAGAHGPAVEQSVPGHDTQTPDPAPQQPAEGEDPPASDPPSDHDAGAPPAPAQGQDGGTLVQPADAGSRDAQAPTRDASSDAAPVAPQADAGAVIPMPDAGQVQTDAGGADGSLRDPMGCLDVAPTHPSLELLGGAPFDCTDTAPCTGSVDNAALERAWCGRDPVAIGTGTQVRWWGYPTLLPEVQVPRSGCVRIIAAGHCTLTSSFGVTYTKWARAPQLNVQGWVEVDTSETGALACSLSCMGMVP